MVWVIAFGSPDNFVIDPKVYASEFNHTYQTFGTMTPPAAVTMSIGLLANAPLSWFLHHYLDNFIVTCPACPFAHLHMIIHSFAFLKFAKPAHEHHLQIWPTIRKPGSLPFIGT